MTNKALYINRLQHKQYSIKNTREENENNVNTVLPNAARGYNHSHVY